MIRSAAVAAAALALGAPVASATYGVGHQIYVVGAKGSGLRSLGDGVHPDRSVAVARSGRLAFVRQESAGPTADDVAGIWTANSDGGGGRRIFAGPPGCSGCIGAPTWSPDGSRLAFARIDGGLWLVDADGRSPRRIAASGTWTAGARGPAWLPNGRSIVFEHVDLSTCAPGHFTNCSQWSIRVARVAGGERVLVRNARDPRVSRDGRWIAYRRVSGGESLGLYVVRVDGRSRRAVWPKVGVGDFAWLSSSGRLVVTWRDGVYAMGRDGRGRRRLGPPAGLLTLSPRGDRLAFADAAGPVSIWTMRTNGTGKRRLAPTDGYHPPESLGWSRDGGSVYFTG